METGDPVAVGDKTVASGVGVGGDCPSHPINTASTMIAHAITLTRLTVSVVGAGVWARASILTWTEGSCIVHSSAKCGVQSFSWKAIELGAGHPVRKYYWSLAGKWRAYCRPLIEYCCQPALLVKTKRAGDGTRTHDILLGKQALYRLSYTRLCLYYNRLDLHFQVFGRLWFHQQWGLTVALTPSPSLPQGEGEHYTAIAQLPLPFPNIVHEYASAMNGCQKIALDSAVKTWYP